MSPSLHVRTAIAHVRVLPSFQQPTCQTLAKTTMMFLFPFQVLSLFQVKSGNVGC